DLDTMGLTESYQRGHDVTVRVTPSTTAVRSSRNYVDVLAAATYTWPIGDGLVQVAASLDNELTTHGVPDGVFSATLHLASPRFRAGPVVFDARVIDRYADYLNTQSTLGGDTRLRGYPAALFMGRNLLEAGLEYRSSPLEIAAMQFGW